MPKPKNAIGNGCQYYKKCGGCQLQNLDYQSQLAYKQSKVKQYIGKYCHINPIIGMIEPYHYRNKVQAAFGYDSHGRIVSGIYQSSTHKIVSVNKCMIENETADEIIDSIKRIIIDLNISVFNEYKNKGFLRHVLVKNSFSTNEIMVVIVGTTLSFPQKEIFLEKLLKRHPDITTVIYNRNDKFTSLVLGEKETVLYGKGYIEDFLCGCYFRISAKSFYQVNPIQTPILYSTAMKYAELTGKEVVLDAYCGTGTIGLIASSKSKQVIGIELNKDAVIDANNNAKRNNITNATFICDDATDYLAKISAEDLKCDVAFIDPPRAGTTAKFILSLTHINPQKVVYVSCNPETLGRDLYYFKKNGYKPLVAQPIDMFPHTNHVETVVLMSKVK